MIQEVSTTITTNGNGDSLVYIGANLRGRVHAIKYTKGTLDAGADLVITGERTGVPILTDSPSGDEWFYPRATPNQVADGAVESDASEEIHVVNERIKVVVAQGGAAGAGTITAYIDSEGFA